jgi:hypothetical protein
MRTMSYFVTVSFGIQGWTEAGTTRHALLKQKMENVGLRQTVAGSKGVSNLPPGTFAGEFKGESTAKIRDDITPRMVEIFKSLGGKGQVFVLVGSDWSWSFNLVA